MKDFDIEKLERKSIHTLPDHFFETVQENVLNKTVRKDTVAKPRRAKLNWWYAAAAAVAMIFGAGYLFTDTSLHKGNTKITASTPESTVEAPAALPPVRQEVMIPEAVSENKDLTLVKDEYQTKALANTEKLKITAKKSYVQPVAAQIQEVSTPSTITVAKPTEAMVDEVLSNFSLAEIKEVSKNTEQDVYLDIYN